MRALLAWWVVGVAVYTSFVSFVWTQLVAGAVAAALAVALSHLAFRAAGLRVAGAAPQVWRLRAVGTILARELRAVATALWALVRGRQPPNARFVAVALPARTGWRATLHGPRLSLRSGPGL